MGKVGVEKIKMKASKTVVGRCKINGQSRAWMICGGSQWTMWPRESSGVSPTDSQQHSIFAD